MISSRSACLRALGQSDHEDQLGGHGCDARRHCACGASARDRPEAHYAESEAPVNRAEGRKPRADLCALLAVVTALAGAGGDVVSQAQPKPDATASDWPQWR